ncbi:PhnE/PtxC family ABC transporter permease [Mycoplasmopsis felifaucium]|uniref:PhnE/PtxC family ABC transporter permease n=1 Tax=Mycoplasmopsis felifaucium TaxID=35768 RepID=UPI00068D7891|nr:hypothetical protein [Mycoplasmopsis felifaucium]
MNKFVFQYWNNDKKLKKLNPWLKYIGLAILIGFALYCVFSINWKTSKYGSELFWHYIKELFRFKSDNPDFVNQNFWIVCLKTIFITLQYTALGSLIGFFIAFFTAYIASNNLHKNKWIVYGIKIIILLLRSIPVFFFLALFKSGFDKLLLATLMLAWFTWLWLHKYICDIFETSETKFYSNDLLLGKSKFKSFINNVSLRNENKIIMLFIFSFESNLRWTTILSSAGLVGIGNFIVISKNSDLAYVGIPLVLLLASLLVLELINIAINQLLFKPKTILPLAKNASIKRMFLRPELYCWVLFGIILAISISTLFKINYSVFNFEGIKHSFKSLMEPDYSYLIKDSARIWQSFFAIIKIASGALFVSFFISLFIALLGNNKLFPKAVSIVIKIILLLIRVIPVVLLFILFKIIYISAEACLFIIIVISTSRSMSKFFIESINAVSDIQINNLKTFGVSKFKILSRFIYPAVKHELLTYTIFRFELAYRNLINLGPLSAVGIGAMLYTYMSKDFSLPKVSALMLPIMISIILIECLNYSISYIRKYRERKYIT